MPGPRFAAIVDLDAEPLTDTRALVRDVLPEHGGGRLYFTEQGRPRLATRARPRPRPSRRDPRVNFHGLLVVVEVVALVWAIVHGRHRRGTHRRHGPRRHPNPAIYTEVHVSTIPDLERNDETALQVIRETVETATELIRLAGGIVTWPALVE
jgi:hypothetical protein